MRELRDLFCDLQPQNRQVGLDDVTKLIHGTSVIGPNMNKNKKTWATDRMKLGEDIAAAGYVPVVQQFSKRGIPNSLRPSVWRKLLGVETHRPQQKSNYFRMLQQQVKRVDLLVDHLFQMDVEHALDDDNFFPFDEMLENLTMCFSRDPWIFHNSTERSAAIIGRNRHGDAIGLIPPCGVQPFRGLVLFFAPLCFVYGTAEEAYFVSRKMYADYWCKLNSITSRPGCIIHLCKTFEDLLQRFEPALFHHLVELGVPPLQVAFSWIQLAFVGYLQIDQILLLWDRIFAHGSSGGGLFLLPVLAASIFVFRSNALMKATDVQDVKDILGDPSKLQIVPLLQHFLFEL